STLSRGSAGGRGGALGFSSLATLAASAPSLALALSLSFSFSLSFGLASALCCLPSPCGCALDLALSLSLSFPLSASLLAIKPILICAHRVPRERVGSDKWPRRSSSVPRPMDSDPGSRCCKNAHVAAARANQVRPDFSSTASERVKAGPERSSQSTPSMGGLTSDLACVAGLFCPRISNVIGKERGDEHKEALKALPIE